MSYKTIEPTINEMNKYEIPCSISILPIQSYSVDDGIKEENEYTKLVQKLAKKNKENRINNDITIKLYQINQYQNRDKCKKEFLELVSFAKSKSIFVWLDTSDRTTHNGNNIIDQTINLYLEAVKKYGINTVGICLQAYLKRTFNDFKKIHNLWGTIRLVNWFYNTYDISSRKSTKAQYMKCAKYALKTNVGITAFATHDIRLVQKIKILINKKNISKVVFQGFIDVNNDLFKKLKNEWYNVRLYIPYGNFFLFLKRGRKRIDKARGIMRILWLPVK